MNPLVIGVVNTKGGTAKTTTAIYLAAAFQARGKTAVVLDLDKQGSATDWADRAAANGDRLPFPVEVANIKRLASYANRDDLDVVIVDTPPGDTQVIDGAIKAAGFVVVPTQASGLDIARVWETLPVLDGRVPYGVLITSARLATTLLDQAKTEFVKHGVACFDTVIPLREKVRDAFGWTPRQDFGYTDVANEIEAAVADE
jgi:chromosome partitioning protein